MPTPKTIKSIAIKISGTGNDSCYAECRNLNTSEYQRKQADSAGEVIFNLSDLSSDGTDAGTKTGVSANDVIEYKVLGNGYGGGTYTVGDTGGKKVSLTLTAYSTSNTVGVSI